MGQVIKSIKTRQPKKPDRRQESERRLDDKANRIVNAALRRSPIAPAGETRIRIKINCVITVPTTGRHCRTNIPWPSVDELIIGGLHTAIPNAKHLLPGATIGIENIDFNADWAAERREEKEKAKKR